MMFIGRLTQQKGVGNLFEAADQLSESITLTVVGKITEDIPILRKNLSKHRYIPSLPHEEILHLVRTQDVLVFPSLFEGFGLVITEAMSQGTPVITTANTCGGDFIKNGENGWLIPCCDTESLVAQLKSILENPDLIVKNGKGALVTAQARPWSKYEAELLHCVKSYL